MSDPTLSDNDLKNKMAWVLTTLNKIISINQFVHCKKIKSGLGSGLSVFTELLKNYTVTTLIRCFLLIFVAGCDVH